MKVTFFMIFVCTFQLVAINIDAQTNIELRTNNVSVKELIKEIEKQTDFLVLFRNNDVDVNRVIHLKHNQGNLSSILNEAFRDTEIIYEFRNKYIILSNVKEAQQQGNRITGAVVDASGESIAGASVIVKGTTNGTATDADGNFTLSNVPDNAVLQV
ncbi:MAG: carboxypeptidase-like regulatory domain-containing protein, partial [Tannerella sp.]|nr:carboxypeptidase-like regulatory domain-containing protein [Tannerella sp.]